MWCGTTHVSVTAWHFIHSFHAKNNSVSSTTDMLATGIKIKKLFVHPKIYFQQYLCFFNSLLEGYACSEWSFFSWWQRECLSGFQLLPDSTGSFGLEQIKKRDRVKNESFRKERCEVSSDWQPYFEVRLSAEGWVCLGRDVLQLFVWIKGPWDSNAWETQEEDISRDGTARWT